MPVDPLQQWEQRQRTRGQPKMSPRARELAAKNVGRLTAGRETRTSLGLEGWVRMVGALVIVGPFAGACGAVIGSGVSGGNQAATVIGAILMIVVPIPFAAQRWLRKHQAKQT